jgi:murein DD-endopeptidase MepM/ murein hydrolase activator NlpD
VPDRDIDPALLVRGVKFDFVTPPLGTDYWRMTEAFWFENAAADIGPDHHILGDVSIDGAQAAAVPLKVTWPSGDTTVTSKSEQESIVYNYDYPMSPSLNEYSIQVSDGKPSDKVSGIGMGAHGNPREHTSTWIAFELVKATVPVPPVQPQPPLPHPPPGGSPGRLLWAVDGPVSQRWGENPEFYQKRLGIPYHNGIDIAVPIGTRVIAAADGVVKWVASDPEGYGLYCRVFFPEFNQHQLVAHMSEVDVQVGQPVGQGDTLGATGNTGLSSGPHAHIETRLGTENAYLQGTYGHSNGRVDPQAVYGALGMAQQPMDGPRQ